MISVLVLNSAKGGYPILVIIAILFVTTCYVVLNTLFTRKMGRVNFYADLIVPISLICLGLLPTVLTFFVTQRFSLQLGSILLAIALSSVSFVFTLIKKTRLNNQAKINA